MAAEITTPQIIGKGDTLKIGYYNGLLQGTSILTLYTGTGFDATYTGTSGSDTDSHEISVAASDLDKLNYVLININAKVACYVTTNSDTGGSSVDVKIEKKYQGGTYSTVHDDNFDSAYSDKNTAESNGSKDKNQYFRLPIVLDSNDKANGITIKISTTCTVNASSSGGASITNKSTWIEGAN